MASLQVSMVWTGCLTLTSLNLCACSHVDNVSNCCLWSFCSYFESCSVQPHMYVSTRHVTWPNLFLVCSAGVCSSSLKTPQQQKAYRACKLASTSYGMQKGPAQQQQVQAAAAGARQAASTSSYQAAAALTVQQQIDTRTMTVLTMLLLHSVMQRTVKCQQH